MEFFKKVFDTMGSILGFETTNAQNINETYGEEAYDPNGYYDDGYAPETYAGDGYDEGQDAYAQGYEEPRESRRRAGGGYAPPHASEDDGNVFGNHRSVPRDNVVSMNSNERRPQQVARVVNLMPEVSNEKQMNEECENLINQLLKGDILLISTVNVDDKQRNRMVLMLSGAAFAVKATFIRINATTYMMAPEGVKVVEAQERPRTATPFFDQNDFFGGVR